MLFFCSYFFILTRLKIESLVFFICLACTVLTYGQPEAAESGQSVQQSTDNKIRVVVEVVSVDAIVTDKEGRHVKDLEMSDFEVYQDGDFQELTNFSYVNAAPGPASDGTVVMTGESTVAGRDPLPEFSKGPERADILRSIAVVVDDIGMSFENLIFVRQALKKFVKEQIQHTDLVAISLTGSRTGALSQFTTNKHLLTTAVDRIRWGPVHRARPLDRSSFDRQFSYMRKGETIEERNLAVGTLQSLKYALNSMKDLPGRKSVILVSEGFRLGYDELDGVGGSTNAMVESLRRVMYEAHRSGAVIYAVDPRGGESLGLHPRDDLSNVFRVAQEVQQEMNEVLARREDVWELIEQGRAPGLRLQSLEPEDVKMLLDPEAIAKISSTRLNRFYQTQQGLNYLPVATGGLYFKYNNDINANLGYVLEDQQGYYLIGYAPDPESIRSKGGRRFPRISVKVKREGLKVRGRATFMGTLDGDQDRSDPTLEERMYQYMTSPFASGQIPLELTSLYEHVPGKGAFVSSWLHVDSKQLTFSEERDGWKKAEMEVWVAAFGEKPKPAGEKRETFSVRVRDQSYERMLIDGLVCKVSLPVQKSGPHQLRMVVRDTSSGRMGSASRFVQIPDIKAGHLALSGIVLRDSELDSVATDADSLTGGDDMALRRFQRGTFLNFALFIYNAAMDRETRNPQLETHMKLFKEGREIYAGTKKKKTFDLNGELEDSFLIASGHFQLGPEMGAGHYAMQYTVTDKLADDEYGTVSQWIDFQILD